MPRLTDKEKKNVYRDWRAEGLTLYQLGQRYNISQAAASSIISKFLKRKDEKKQKTSSVSAKWRWKSD
ncbi:sigma factor-like helix-turn-helix DNA-binding protein [Sphingobacterium thalpophilum]|uniref:sigma factor-like helix-turn-helix DNA-binding protein n=1 Tax=Sphingobacterium thalpophilum TaxID=259 RepID=UPI00396F698A